MSADWYEGILLEDDQRQLLGLMVQADDAVAKQKRDSFVLVQTQGGDFLIREGMSRERLSLADLTTLVGVGLLREHRGSGGNHLYDVTPEGRRYWAETQRRRGAPIQVVESEIQNFLDSADFIARFSQAHDRWAEAAAELWAADSEQRYTDIGHRCREAMQFFAGSLIQQSGIGAGDVSRDPGRTVDRIRAVIARKGDVGDTERAFLSALIDYWGTVSDLVQRQEHGAQREERELTWEDARRVVFHTAVVMYEMFRALL